MSFSKRSNSCALSLEISEAFHMRLPALESTVTSLAFAGVIADAAVGVTAFGFLTIPASTL